MFHWTLQGQDLCLSTQGPFRFEPVAKGSVRVFEGDRDLGLAQVHVDTDCVWVAYQGRVYSMVARRPQPPSAHDAHGGDIKAPMAATLKRVLVKEGDKVAEGQVLAMLEAMKMQIPLKAVRAARVVKVLAAPGEFLQDGRTVFEMTEIEGGTHG